MRRALLLLVVVSCTAPPEAVVTEELQGPSPIPSAASIAERRAVTIRFRPSTEAMRTVVKAMAPVGLTVGEVVDHGTHYSVHGRGPTMTSVNELARALNRLVRTSRRELAWEVDRFEGAGGVRATLRGPTGPIGDRDLWSLSWFTIGTGASEEVAGGPTTFELQLIPLG